MLNGRWQKWALEALAIIAVIVAVSWWQTRGLPSGPAPALAGNSLDGKRLELKEMLQAANGRPVLVTFWATWCPTCKTEEGNLRAVAADHPLVSVALWSEGSEKVSAYALEHQLDFPIINDPDSVLGKAWHVSGVPSHFVVDSAGNVRFRVVGYTTTWGLRARFWWAERFPL
jgi:thiol-disulfide isomerase/thioredoxin